MAKAGRAQGSAKGRPCPKEEDDVMAEPLSKNARVGIVTQKFFCTCGGEIKMKLVFNSGKLRNVAECEKCKRSERKPSDFKA
jgi:hypothetical protein